MTYDDNWSYYSQNTPYYGEGMVKMFYDILAEEILKLSLVAVYNRWLQGSSGSRSLNIAFDTTSGIAGLAPYLAQKTL